ncbi:MAG: hypothetical protein KME31_32500 [Tolypothrix carrinoi HA7290-LM1]|nr:hypothetical protein [Tolypothrix carrinoi HA7290-LM1]
MAVADVVVGGAGYNTVYECAALGVPLVAIALKRLYDRQDKTEAQMLLGARYSECYRHR